VFGSQTITSGLAAAAFGVHFQSAWPASSLSKPLTLFAMPNGSCQQGFKICAPCHLSSGGFFRWPRLDWPCIQQLAVRPFPLLPWSCSMMLGTDQHER
jgi:hypothetical protein